jgi:hypothetical protein
MTDPVAGDSCAVPTGASYPWRMDLIDLRRCPFCGNPKLAVLSHVTEGGEARCVVCPECHAHGPLAVGNFPPGHVEFLWNVRYGADN